MQGKVGDSRWVRFKYARLGRADSGSASSLGTSQEAASHAEA